MYIVTLLYQAADGAAHGDDIVIGVRRKDYHTLRERFGTFGTVGVVGVRLAARPSRDGVLQVVEYLDVHIVGRSVESQQFAQAVLVVVLVGQLQDGFACELAQPYDGASDELVVPFAGSHQPGTLDTCQVGGSREVDYDVCVVVRLQIGCGDGVGDVAFHTFFHHFGFLFSPGHEVDFLGGEDGRYSHRDGADGRIVDGSEYFGGIVA